MYTFLEENGNTIDVKCTIKGIIYNIGTIQEVYNNKYCAFVTGNGQIKGSDGYLFDSVKEAQKAITEEFIKEYSI